jgi:hypothetical protein
MSQEFEFFRLGLLDFILLWCTISLSILPLIIVIRRQVVKNRNQKKNLRKISLFEKNDQRFGLTSGVKHLESLFTIYRNLNLNKLM